uniref:Uncharacterized protein n=1 Tax=Ascaris lumbricoides TaxID=6252 RepID=A0A0M3I8D3_ASCLU
MQTLQQFIYVYELLLDSPIIVLPRIKNRFNVVPTMAINGEGDKNGWNSQEWIASPKVNFHFNDGWPVENSDRLIALLTTQTLFWSVGQEDYICASDDIWKYRVIFTSHLNAEIKHHLPNCCRTLMDRLMR